MAKLTWLGEDTPEIPGPSFIIWNGHKFPKGRQVEVTDPVMIRKAQGSRFFRVAEPKPQEAPSAQTSEAKVEAKAVPEKTEAKAAPGRKDPADYPPVKKAPKKQVRKPKPAAHAHR